MIRYTIPAAELRKRVDARSGTWRDRAKGLTSKAVVAGKVLEGDAIWSEVKPIFLDIQGNKCVYCERLLPGEELGLVEHDVEHYRPKNRITEWPAKKDLKALGLAAYPFPTGGPAAQGYISLAFDLSNYGAACKTCNSSLKADRFPIAGNRAAPPFTPAKLKAEDPFLLLPLAPGEDDPEQLIGFNGIIPFPLNADNTSRAHRRAKVTIDFFRLASLQRESELLEDRLRSLNEFAMTRRFRQSQSGAAAAVLDQAMKAMSASTRPHANCVRSYVRLCHSQPAAADQMADLFLKLIEKGIRKMFQNLGPGSG
jgi:hypothetical protein